MCFRALESFPELSSQVINLLLKHVGASSKFSKMGLSRLFLNALVVFAIVPLSPAMPMLLAPRSSLTASQLASIAPASTTCDGAQYPNECRTAVQALPYILQSFETYQINSAAAQAAIISTLAFESGDFKYQRNYFPGNPGQGTRNMQSATFNLQYAQSIPELSGRIAGAQASGPNGVRDLLISNDAWDFGSGAWFLVNQCGQSVLTALAQGGENGLAAYLACIGTAMTEDRQTYWTRASAALGLGSLIGMQRL